MLRQAREDLREAVMLMIRYKLLSPREALGWWWDAMKEIRELVA